MTGRDTKGRDEHGIPWTTAWIVSGDLFGVIAPVLMFLLIGFVAWARFF